MARGRTVVMVAVMGMSGALAMAPASAQHQHGGMSMPMPPAAPAAGGGRHVTMDELHASGGVPPGWTFTVPAGDAARGRQVFANLECHKCHVVKNGGFPAPTGAGPELTGMGAHHPAEYFAESILAPNAVIVDGPGYTGPDGKSTMPSYADTLTLAQWTDIVAYLKSLGGETMSHEHGAAPRR